MTEAKDFQSRHWVFTYNNPPVTDIELHALLSAGKHVSYFVFQLEKAPTTGLEHFQGYIEFSRSTRMGAVKKVFNCESLHLEKRRGTQAEAIAYCKKEDSRQDSTREPMEWGVPAAGQGKRSDIDEVVEFMTETKPTLVQVAEAFPKAIVKYSRGLQTLSSLLSQPKMRDGLTVNVFWGSSSVGKTHYVVNKLPPHLYHRLSAKNGQWWDGLEPTHTHLWIDEYKGEMPLDLFKEVTDKYPYRVPIKGGFVSLNVTTIWITSQISPDDWYPHVGADRVAFMRRLTNIYYWNSKEDHHVPDDFVLNPDYSGP